MSLSTVRNVKIRVSLWFLISSVCVVCKFVRVEMSRHSPRVWTHYRPCDLAQDACSFTVDFVSPFFCWRSNWLRKEGKKLCQRSGWFGGFCRWSIPTGCWCNCSTEKWSIDPLIDLCVWLKFARIWVFGWLIDWLAVQLWLSHTLSYILLVLLEILLLNSEYMLNTTSKFQGKCLMKAAAYPNFTRTSR